MIQTSASCVCPLHKQNSKIRQNYTVLDSELLTAMSTQVISVHIWSCHELDLQTID